MRKTVKYKKIDSNVDKYMIKGISLMDVQLFVNELKISKDKIMIYQDIPQKSEKEQFPLNAVEYVDSINKRTNDFYTGNDCFIITNEKDIELLKEIVEEEEEADIHIVDFHGESTSEKQIMGYVFDGQISALLGTHTHVQTRDARILEKGTAFISDAGMCGALDGVIGWDKETVINKMIFGSSKPFQVATSGKKMFNGVVLNIDEVTGKCKEIFTLYNVLEC